MTVIKRRQFLRLGASAMVGLTALPFSAIAGKPEMAAAIKDLFGDKPSGRARAAGKIRLGGSQIVHAVAEHNDGRLFGTSAKVFVTLAACVVN